MGKARRVRQKLHIAPKKDNNQSHTLITSDFNTQNLPDIVLPLPSDNLFAGLNIDINKLNTKLNDDIQSIKSFKSLKSDKSSNTILSKKEKLKIRKEMLMRKIDTVNQMKKDLKIREKRKNTATMDDTNPLHDALPSLKSLLKNKPSMKQNVTEPKVKKGIEKAKKRKKEAIQGIKIFKSMLNDKEFKKTPFDAITQHVQAVVNQEKHKVLGGHSGKQKIRK